MNARIKGALILGLMLVAIASALYIVPALAHMNGDCDQTRDLDRLRERDCSCICLQEQNQTQSQIQNQTRTRTCWS
jgi:hypothetical protein